MKLASRLSPFVIAALAGGLFVSIQACSNRLHVDNEHLKGLQSKGTANNLESASNPNQSASTGTQAGAASGSAQQSPEEFNVHTVDYAAETEVSEQSVKAWRLAIDGKGDQSLKILGDLERKYPRMKTVCFMKGQVLERLGRKEEAIKWYQAAVTGNEFDFMNVFKLAELQRQTGKNKEAIESYHRLLAEAPNFKPAQIGLARACLNLDPGSAEARKSLQSMIDSDPKLTDPATQEAKVLLQRQSSPKDKS